MGSNQWANRAKKSMTRNSDAKKLDYIQDNLPKEIRVTSRERIYHSQKFTTKNQNHEADLVLNEGIILHHDTIKIHGELAFPNPKTLKRDMDFERAGFNYIVLNADLAKHLTLDEARLVEYLYYHELHKSKIREELHVCM